MTRPQSHCEQIPSRRCGNCRFAHIPEYKDDLLCFFGDAIESEQSYCNSHKSVVMLDGDHVGLLDGQEYDPVWANRVVDCTDICDEWKPKEPTK